MSGWSDFIQTGSYAGVEFDFVSTEDERSRVVDRQEIPNRDGVFLEDRARGGRVTDVIAIFVEDDYPDVMNALLDKVDAGGVQEFVHPIWGKTKALITRGVVSHNADDSIDSATCQLHIEEHTDAAAVTTTKTSVAAKTGSLLDAVVAALNALTAFEGAIALLQAIPGTIDAAEQGVINQAIDDGNTACTLGGAAADNFQQNGDEMSADEVQAQANAVLTACNAVIVALSSFVIGTGPAVVPVPEQYDYVQALVTLAAAVTDLAETVATGLPQLTVYTVEADISLLMWVLAKYGDSSRAAEVLALNPWIADPLLILAGSQVTAYAS